MCDIKLKPGDDKSYSQHLHEECHIKKIQVEQKDMYAMIDSELLTIGKAEDVEDFQLNDSDSYSFTSYPEDDFEEIDIPVDE